MRLGDMIDDHRSGCKRTTDHAIVAMNGDDVVKVVLPHLQFGTQVPPQQDWQISKGAG